MTTACRLGLSMWGVCVCVRVCVFFAGNISLITQSSYSPATKITLGAVNSNVGTPMVSRLAASVSFSLSIVLSLFPSSFALSVSLAFLSFLFCSAFICSWVQHFKKKMTSQGKEILKPYTLFKLINIKKQMTTTQHFCR